MASLHITFQRWPLSTDAELLLPAGHASQVLGFEASPNAQYVVLVQSQIMVVFCQSADGKLTVSRCCTCLVCLTGCGYISAVHTLFVCLLLPPCIYLALLLPSWIYTYCTVLALAPTPS